MSNQAACVLITNDEGKILTVSRKDNPNDIGLPGGKFDAEDETLQFTAFRECLEETGLIVNVLSNPIYVGVDNGTGKEFIVSTFLGKLTDIKANVDISANETGVVAWRDPVDLLNSSSFSKYNRYMLAHGSFDNVYHKYVITYSGPVVEDDTIYGKDKTDAIKNFLKKHKQGSIYVHAVHLVDE